MGTSSARRAGRASTPSVMVRTNSSARSLLLLWLGSASTIGFSAASASRA